MNWKKFLLSCSSLGLLISFPYNIIGCAGGEPDPYDYFVSFFNTNLGSTPGYEPFYYTNYEFLYKNDEPVNTATVTAAEWIPYAGNKFTDQDASAFVNQYARKDLAALYNSIEKSTALTAPDSVKNNGMTRFFQDQKDLEALGYLMYAKQVEPDVTGSWSEWEPVQRDSAKMAKLIKNGQQLYNASKKDFIRLRYAYQVLRLAHYSHRYQDCLNWYDELVKSNTTPSVLQDLCVSLRAGALLHTGHNAEAAYIFSKLFSKSNVRKVSNYMSFDWCVKRFDENSRKECLAYCKNDEEKANMLGLFLLGSNETEIKALQQIYNIYPASSILQLLTVREIQKQEEHYFTPSLRSSVAERGLYNYYGSMPDSALKNMQRDTRALSGFCKTAATGKNGNKGFYLLAAAHTAMIGKDFTASRQLLDEAKKASLSQQLQDQWAMTNLVLTINQQQKIDAAFEAQLLPSIQWLEKKAKDDQEYAKFYRRLFADVLSAKYEDSNNKVRDLFCIAVADKINADYVKESWGYYSQSFDMLRNKLTAEQVEETIRLMESKTTTAYEKYLISRATFKAEDVNDVAGTAWLRRFNFTEAEKWFKKIPANYYAKEPYHTYMAANPFADLLLDVHAPTKQDTVRYTKLTFTQRMLKLEQQLNVAKNNEQMARLCYEIAKGLYHMSYWGNSWMMVQYGWGSSEWDNSDTSSKTSDYYSVQKAKNYYLQAYKLSGDANFKARSLFMAAKCDQKQAGILPNTYADDYKKQLSVWLSDFDKRNSYFTTLNRQYASTAFYKEAFNTCSYLKDFVQKSGR
ncbi:MAG: hypothetical protein QM731_23200 [Chitinophagaceae bacterium]